MNGQNTTVGPDSGAGHEPPQGLRPGRSARFAWLPIPLLLLAIIVGRAAGLHESYTAETLTLILSFIFYTLVSLGTLFLIGRSFLALGTPGLLLMECGVILWCLAGTVGDAVSHGNANVNVTIFNTGILLAGLCHLAGAIISLRPQRALRATSLWLGVGSVLTLGTLWLVTWAALSNWLPVFFVPGQGGTTVRYFVLVSAITMFVLSAGLLHANQRMARLPFTTWYVLALLLLAVGLFGIMIQLSLGSVVNWLGRMAQWLGGVYLFFAALASLRESQLPLLPPERKSHPAYYRDAIAVAVVITAAAIRLTFLSAMGTQAPYLIFFPAVMFAALYGGRRAGLLAMALSAILTNYFWVEPVGQFTGQPANQLALVVFLVSSAMIIWITDAMHRARTSAFAFETQALIAAEREAVAVTLRESEERYHNLFNMMNEGFCVIEMVFDAEGRPVDYRFLEINAAFEKQTGLIDAKGKLMRDLAPANERHWFEIYGKIALTGEPQHFVNEARALNRWFDVYAYRVGNPEDRQVAIVFNDITDSKQAEETLRKSETRLSQALRIANVGSWEWELQSGEVSWSDEMYRMFGEERGSFLPTYGFFLSRIHMEDREEVEEVVRDSLARRGSYEIEYRIITGTSEVRSVLAHGEVLSDSAGVPSRVIGTAIDLTARKKAEEDLRKAHAELELRIQERTYELSEAYNALQKEMDDHKKTEEQLIRVQKLEALGTLAGGIAHDFNNILAGIIGFTEMVSEDLVPDSPEYRKLGLVLKGANRGRDLVKQILAFSRKAEQDKKPLAMNYIVEEGLKLLRPTLPSTIEIALESVTDDDTIYADPAQMHQVLMNLATNASYAMREKGGILHIGISKAAFTEGNSTPFLDMTPGCYVILKVRDTGSGMPPETLDRIFDPFFTTKDQGEGTGLGLSVVHGIIKSHGGYISVASEPDKGTTFHIYLPMINKQALSVDRAVPAATGGNERILIVDDEDILVELNKQRLSKLGYEVVATTSSIDALDIFRKGPDTFDLVITDQTMPNLTGIDLASELLKIRATVPIILCTGHSETVSPEMAKKAGIRQFLMKPLVKQELAQAIRRILDAKAD